MLSIINNQYKLNQHIRLNQLEPTKSISVIVNPPPLNLPSTSIGSIFQSCFQAAKVIVHLAERPVTVSPNLAKHKPLALPCHTPMQLPRGLQLKPAAKIEKTPSSSEQSGRASKSRLNATATSNQLLQLQLKTITTTNSQSTKTTYLITDMFFWCLKSSPDCEAV